MRRPFLPSRSENGQSLVELAISLMVILLLLTGAVEIGLALFQYVTMRDAAQEGALYGSLSPDDVEGIKERAKAAANDVLPLESDAIAVSYSDDALAFQCEGVTVTAGTPTPHSVTVTITFAHPVFMPLIGAWIGETINLTAAVTDTILQPPCET